MNNTEFSPQNTNPNNQDSGWNQMGRLPRTEKIKRHPIFAKISLGLATLALAATGVNFIFNQQHEASTPHHYLTEWEDTNQFKVHGAAQITVGGQGATLQIIRDDIDGQSGEVFQKVGNIDANSTFRVGHYATSASEYKQQAEKNAGIEVISLLRDDIPEEYRHFDGDNQDPYFQIVVDRGDPNIKVENA